MLTIRIVRYALVTALALCAIALGASPAYAAETADWLPLKGTYKNAIGCTWEPNGCGLFAHTGGKKGIDFIVPTNTKIYAAGPGTVISYGGCNPTNSPGCNDDAGNYIVISHPDGRQSRYLHLSRIVKPSGSVARGTLIGYSGGSGFSSNIRPHLHYDERINGSSVDPGPMQAVHGGSLKKYPNALGGYPTWNNVPAHGGHTVRNDSFKPPINAPWQGVGGAKFLGTYTLTAGKRIHGGEYILSENGQHALLMQKDGNLVLGGHGRVIWESKTAGHNGASLVVQADGNVVIYHNGKALWSTRTAGTGVNRLVMQSDGNLVARTASNQAKWASNTDGYPTYVSRGTNELRVGERLSSGQYIRSSDKRYALLMQEDGNLALYGPGFHVLWTSKTAGHNGASLVVQGDGNIVIYDDGKALWETNTENAQRLVVQDDGNLVAYGQGVARWASNTAGRI